MIIIALALATQAQSATSKDFDERCAIAMLQEYATLHPDLKNTAMAMHSFFMGRLSVKDPSRRWSSVVKDAKSHPVSSAELLERAKPCVAFFNQISAELGSGETKP